jgi:cysteine desulfurase
MTTIYLDNNATTPPYPAVLAAMEPYWATDFANPSSLHGPGRLARKAAQDARECVADLLDAHPDEVLFTSGGTEANNLALLGVTGGRPAHAVFSPIEHPCVAECSRVLEGRGWRVATLDVDHDGLIDPAHLASQIRNDTRVVSVMLANNDTGVIEPIERLAELSAGQGVPFHTDAVQAVGKTPVRFHELGVATLALSAHKFHGPKGIGALLVRRDVRLEPLLYGGHQQQGVRPGTEPVALLVGLSEALRLASRRLEERAAQLRSLRDRLERGLVSLLSGVVRNGPAEPRLPNTLNLSFPGLDSEELLVHLDLAGIACSAGSACASGSTEPSPTLIAMGRPETILRSSLRFSIGDQNTSEEIDRAIDRIVQVVTPLRASGPVTV